ncbi:MAG: WG repeat-containing protein [Aridibacter sp.]
MEKNGAYIDKTGKIVIKPQFDKTSPFKEGMALVEIGEKSGFIDTTGKMVIPLGSYNFLGEFSEGLAVVESENMFGFIDKNRKGRYQGAIQGCQEL